MNSNNQLVLNIAIVFENTDSRVWTSSTLSPNHYLVFFPTTWFFGLNCFLKKELTTNQSLLVEHSAIDNLDYQPDNIALSDLFLKNKLSLYYIYYMYHLKLKLTFFLTSDSNNNIYSVDSIYSNASWLERESSEMYGVYFTGKKDTRKLLLDYSKIDCPMLKDFSTEGVIDCFYNFFEEQVCTVNSAVVEL